MVILFAGIIGAKLFFIQVVRGDYYRARAVDQSQTASTLFDRGTIFFSSRDGQLTRAEATQTGYTLAINPSRLTDSMGTFNILRQIIPSLDQDDFTTRASKVRDPYEEIATRLPTDLGQKIKSLKLAGVQIVPDRWRSYPAGRMASHTIGFMGYEDDLFAGRYGLERRYDSYLVRQNNLSFTSFFTEIFSGLGDTLIGRHSREEADLVTTIEPVVQSFVEEQLTAITERWHSRSSGIVVLEPATGQILAMGARPDFDPGKKQESIEPLKNPLVEDVWEMGSILKPLTLAAAIDTGVVTPSSTYIDTGSVTLNGLTITNHDGRAHGQVTMQEVLSQSLNTGAVYAATKLGHDKFRRYFLDFGLGEITNIDLPNESFGLVSNLDSQQEVDYVTASFGQGIAVTPINIVRALGVLANGGRLMRPYVVKRLDYLFRPAEDLEPLMQRQVIKPETAATITTMLVKIVDETLAGGRAKLPNHSIAAKTGTAQIADPTTGGYHTDRFLHSFFGYFPAKAPRFLVFIYQVEPVGANYASETLTDPFMNLAKFLLNYYKVSPDRVAQ